MGRHRRLNRQRQLQRRASLPRRHLRLAPRPHRIKERKNLQLQRLAFGVTSGFTKLNPGVGPARRRGPSCGSASGSCGPASPFAISFSFSGSFFAAAIFIASATGIWPDAISFWITAESSFPVARNSAAAVRQNRVRPIWGAGPPKLLLARGYQLDPNHQHIPPRIIDRHILPRLKESQLPHPLRRHARRRKVRHAARLELHPHIRNVHLGRQNRQPHRAHLAHRRLRKRQHNVQIVDHQVQHHVHVQRPRRKHAQPVRLKEHRPLQIRFHRQHRRVEPLQMPRLQNLSTPLVLAIRSSASRRLAASGFSTSRSRPASSSAAATS
jgi:hypothetical protein